MDIEYHAIREIKRKLWELVDADSKLWLEPRNTEEPNPFYGATQSGLFLELYYSTPNMLHTPWGRLHLAGSSMGSSAGFAEVTARLNDAFGGHRVREFGHSALGEIGEMYALTKYSGGALPLAVHASGSLDYETAKNGWRDISARLGSIHRV